MAAEPNAPALVPLAAARSLTFHSDASKNRLLLLCEMCGDDLVPGHCLLGTADLEDDCSAAGLMTTVLRILKDLFTPLMGAPRLVAAGVDTTTTDLQALDHVANIAEVLRGYGSRRTAGGVHAAVC